MTTIDGLLVGIIVTMSLVASTFFLKFWYATRDRLFLAFAFSFAVEGSTRLISLYQPMESDGIPGVYLARLIAYILIIVAIIYKNRGAGSR